MTASDWSPTEARERADGIVALHRRGGDPSGENPWCDECVDNNGNAMDFPCPTLIEARDVIEALKEVTRVNDYLDGLTADHASMTKRIAELESVDCDTRWLELIEERDRAEGLLAETNRLYSNYSLLGDWIGRVRALLGERGRL